MNSKLIQLLLGIAIVSGSLVLGKSKELQIIRHDIKLLLEFLTNHCSTYLVLRTLGIVSSYYIYMGFLNI
jgi:hypothetical protein